MHVVYASSVGMYLRTTKRKNRDGSAVEYYQLAHNVRHAEKGKPVAEIIHISSEQMNSTGMIWSGFAGR